MLLCKLLVKLLKQACARYLARMLSQFYMMSLGGQLGSMLAVLGLLLTIPLDNSGRYMLIAATAGAAIFGGIIEWPVLRRTRESRDPFTELSRIDKATIQRAGLVGVGSTIAIWMLLA